MLHRLALLCFCCAFGLSAFIVLDTWQFQKLTLPLKFEQLWAEDLELMREEWRLPKEWSSIREISLIGGNDETKAWLEKVATPVEINKDGSHKLEILVVSFKSEGKRGVYLQYDLVDLTSPTGNTIFETSRSLILSDPNSFYERYIKRHPAL